nr:hypothetical protein [uncultured Moellerella sp.]
MVIIPPIEEVVIMNQTTKHLAQRLCCIRYEHSSFSPASPLFATLPMEVCNVQ